MGILKNDGTLNGNTFDSRQIFLSSNARNLRSEIAGTSKPAGSNKQSRKKQIIEEMRAEAFHEGNNYFSL